MQSPTVVPTLSRSETIFVTSNPDFAACLIADKVLELLNWDLSTHAGHLDFRFNDPEGVGPKLELEFEFSRENRLFGIRKVLINKVKEVCRPARGNREQISR